MQNNDPHPSEVGASEVMGELLREVKRLNARLDRLEPLQKSAESVVGGLPDLLATLVDVFDDWAAAQAQRGVHVAEVLEQALRTALWLGERISEVELERLAMLLRSDVIDRKALEVVGNAATALVECQRTACEKPKPEEAGLLAAWAALRDPQTRQSLAFAIRFSKEFGKLVGKPCRGSSDHQESL